MATETDKTLLKEEKVPAPDPVLEMSPGAIEKDASQQAYENPTQVASESMHTAEGVHDDLNALAKQALSRPILNDAEHAEAKGLVQVEAEKLKVASDEALHSFQNDVQLVLATPDKVYQTTEQVQEAPQEPAAVEAPAPQVEDNQEQEELLRRAAEDQAKLDERVRAEATRLEAEENAAQQQAEQLQQDQATTDGMPEVQVQEAQPDVAQTQVERVEVNPESDPDVIAVRSMIENLNQREARQNLNPEDLKREQSRVRIQQWLAFSKRFPEKAEQYKEKIPEIKPLLEIREQEAKKVEEIPLAPLDESEEQKDKKKISVEPPSGPPKKPEKPNETPAPEPEKPKQRRIDDIRIQAPEVTTPEKIAAALREFQETEADPEKSIKGGFEKLQKERNSEEKPDKNAEAIQKIKERETIPGTLRFSILRSLPFLRGYANKREAENMNARVDDKSAKLAKIEGNILLLRERMDQEKTPEGKKAYMDSIDKLNKKSELIKAKMVLYEDRRDNLISETVLDNKRKMAPWQERIDQRERDIGMLKREIDEHNKFLAEKKAQLLKLNNGNVSRPQTIKALEKEIIKHRAILAKRVKDLDKLEAKLTPLTGKVARMKAQNETFDDIKTDNRLEERISPLQEDAETGPELSGLRKEREDEDDAETVVTDNSKPDVGGGGGQEQDATLCSPPGEA